MASPRTYLFVPGNRPERFAKALASGADAVVLDLEDAVAADAKADARAAAGPLRVLALIETARGVEQAGAVAAADGVTRLVFGTLDLALDLDLDIEQAPDGLGYAASRLAVASRIAGLPAPVAGVTPQLGDQPRLLADLAWSRRHGFGAKLCIHPAQVEPIHTALAPDAEAVAWAHRVLAADQAAPGATRLDGRMIDRPVVLQAARTLARAGH